MKGRDDMSKIEIDELTVKKHLKVGNKDAILTVDTGAHGIGVFFSRRDQPDTSQFSVYCDGKNFSAMFWPPKEFWDQGKKGKYPFAISEQGLQFPRPDGTVKIIPLKALVSLLDALSAGVGELHPKLATPLASPEVES